MRVLKILIVMLILIMSVGAVCAAESIADDAISDDGEEILETSSTIRISVLIMMEANTSLLRL